MKINFVKLFKLSELWKDDARWQANVSNSVPDGWSITSDSEEGEAVVEQFCISEFEATDEITMYDFAGSANESERFYLRDELILVHKVTGEYWVIDNDKLYSF